MSVKYVIPTSEHFSIHRCVLLVNQLHDLNTIAMVPMFMYISRKQRH